jgi:hypothetical protein
MCARAIWVVFAARFPRNQYYIYLVYLVYLAQRLLLVLGTGPTVIKLGPWTGLLALKALTHVLPACACRSQTSDPRS